MLDPAWASSAAVGWLSKGHAAEATSVEVGRGAACRLAVSASEDGSCRVWDLRTSRSTRVVLAPNNKAQREEVGHAVLGGGPGAEDTVVWTCAGRQVRQYDLRRPEVVLCEWASCADDPARFAADEVNELAVHADGKHVLAADDAGQVSVLEFGSAAACKPEPSLRCRVAAHEHSCFTVDFRPGQDWGSFVSGGFDSRLQSWDGKRRKPRHRALDVGLASDPNAATSSGAQAVNPPLVHSTKFSPEGAWLAVGLGDSTVALARGSQPTRPLARFGAHLAAVCQVVPLAERACAGGVRVPVVTASSDRTIKLWGLDGASEGGKGAVPDFGEPRLLWSLELPGKPNRFAVDEAAGVVLVALAGLPDPLVVSVPFAS